jgi:hypothetical protein
VTKTNKKVYNVKTSKIGDALVSDFRQFLIDRFSQKFDVFLERKWQLLLWWKRDTGSVLEEGRD